MRIHSQKAKRKRNDSGETTISVMAAVALGLLLAVGGAMVYSNANENRRESTAIESKKSSISDTLNRTSQAIQVANPVLLAKSDELVIERKDAAGVISRTRWVKSGTTLYQQSWTGVSTDYPGGSAWISPTTDKASAPNGDGTQTSTVALTDVSASVLYKYVDKEGAAVALDADGKTVSNILDISRVDVELQANAISGKTSPVNNETKVALRNGVGTPSNDTVPKIECPAVTLDPASTTVPKLKWSVISGITSYEIRRNDIPVTTITLASSNTTGSWTDTAAPTSTGESIDYQVLGKDSSGALSAQCRTTTWRVQISAPVFQDSTVLPKGTEASAWTTAPDDVLDHPRITLDWTTVPGATAYQLLYRLLDAAGNPSSPDFKTMTGASLSPSTTSYVWDGATWGARYEFFVQASAKGAGSKDSRHIQILTHPKTPDNVQVTAAYGAGADKTVNGYNKLSWDASATAARYEVWRYDSGSSGAASLAGTTTGTTFNDTVPYGSTYTYYVTAKNFGPRGVGSTGVDVTAFRSSPSPESSVDDASTTAVGVSYKDPAGSSSTSGGVYYGNAAVTATRASVATAIRPAGSARPMTATQLQYPPIPAVKGASGVTAGTRDLDGTNQISWTAAKSATAYQVTRHTASGDASVCVTATNCDDDYSGVTSTIYTESAAPGTRFAYGVRSFNGTGGSVTASASATITQRPAAPPLTVTKNPSITTANANFTIKQNADAGNSGADLFCTLDDCAYQLLRNGQVMNEVKHLQSGQTYSFTDMPNPDGASVTWTARAKNEATWAGGWSDTAAKVVNTYPGQFGVTQWLGDGTGDHRQRFLVDLTNTDIYGSSVTVREAGFTSIGWTDPAGIGVDVRVRRIAVANESTSTDSAKGLPSPGGIDTTFDSSVNNYSAWASPGATYKYEMTAESNNGLQRKVTTSNMNTPVDLPRHGTTIVTCAKPTYPSDASYAGHLHSTRLQDFQHAPRYGQYTRVNVVGITWFQGQANPSWTNEANFTSDGDFIANNGVQYYQGIASGFDVTTVGTNAENSVTIRQSITSFSPFASGCAADGKTGWDLWEPTYACYGYNPGDPTCYTNSPENRPQWRSK